MSGRHETFTTELGQRIFNVHPRSDCRGSDCPVHNPSEHYLAASPRNYDNDRRLMERVCEHGLHHPDPDALAHMSRTAGTLAAQAAAVHDCDGCCEKPVAGPVTLKPTVRERLSPLAVRA